MGYFSNLLDVTPHRTVGLEAKEYCINTAVTDFENNIIKIHELNKEEFIKIRNSYHIKMFSEMFHVLHQQNPGGSFGVADTAFQANIREYHSSFAESEKYNMNFSEQDWGNRALWEDLIDSFYKRISGKKYGGLTPDEQNLFQSLAERYQNEILEFFKKNSGKLRT